MSGLRDDIITIPLSLWNKVTSGLVIVDRKDGSYFVRAPDGLGRTITADETDSLERLGVPHSQ